MIDERVDATARDGMRTLLPRLVIAALAAQVAGSHLGVRQALGWLSFIVMTELWSWQCSKMLEHGSDDRLRRRLVYISSTLTASIIWTSLPVMFLWSGVPETRIAAVILLISQLIHTQAFAFRSPVVLIFKVTLPSIALIVMPWVVGTIHGQGPLTTSIASSLCIGYIIASIRAKLNTDALLRRTTDELQRFAYFDALTSLANRRQFVHHLRELIELSSRQRSSFALLLIDLDRFKAVNDMFGHDAGDALLVAAAERLRSAAGAPNLVARLGGDEFAVLVPEISNISSIEAICLSFFDSFQILVQFNGERIPLSSSVGISIYPGDGDCDKALFKSADLALYEAKRSGRSTWRFSNRIDTAA